MLKSEEKKEGKKEEKKEEKINVKGDRVALANISIAGKRFGKGQVITGLTKKELESLERFTKPVKIKK